MGLDWGRLVELVVEYVRKCKEELHVTPTLRAVHYHLVTNPEAQGLGYKNTIRCYRRLSEVLARKRYKGELPIFLLKDTEREICWVRPSGGEARIEEDLLDLMMGIGKDPWVEMGRGTLVVLEKKGLKDMVKHVTDRYYVPLLVGRGYSSVTAVGYLVRDVLHEYKSEGVPTVDYGHIGDFDPSGWDIQRDLSERIRRVSEVLGLEIPIVEVERIALTKEQIVRWNLPPMPAKTTDPRHGRYKELISKYPELYEIARQFGGEPAWEVDALLKDNPKLLGNVTEEWIRARIDWDVWRRVEEENRKAREEAKRKLLEQLKGGRE